MTTGPAAFAEDEFMKAKRSDPKKECVEVARRDGWVEVRNSRMTWRAKDDHRLRFTATEFDAFLEGVRCGQFDGHCIEIVLTGHGLYLFRSTVGEQGTPELEFTAGEIEAFLGDVRDGEFTESAMLARRMAA
ncbi:MULTISPECIES: DUF397 domain-containing protein [unclassified Crossiella]|uniref:DUF397 domain-containing protein n=1 Tax=unclassified Crossiella TaxID=2620835 RepID=UPI001FFF8D7F|nr:MULTISPECIES: DUF397 domain-containing protein [unclassified Crossiella]MCK2239735.1 DUF397 domain-containing protein [Crossiella sp. S99.2]MCK2252430.1 DUF397 domain-containing protein [Crossiella sp. S99.1]